jgi:prophage antirepressor-like protein
MIEIFKNEQFGNIRVAGTNEEPLFCLADICSSLDLRQGDVRQRLCDGVVSTQPIIDSLGREQQANFINEDGLYDVILDSRKPEAKNFRKWITSDVLPSIRKNGIYATEDTIDKILSDPDFGIKLLTELKEERKMRLDSESKNAILMHVNKTYTMTEIAKELNLKSAIELNNKLSDMKIQFKTNKTWVLYSKYSNLGYEEIKQEILDNGRVVYHRKITQIGRDFIINLFKY